MVDQPLSAGYDRAVSACARSARVLRGLADDKHLAKRVAVAHGVPTAPWAVDRQGAAIGAGTCPQAARYVVKPNASSASWGISSADDWQVSAPP